MMAAAESSSTLTSILQSLSTVKPSETQSPNDAAQPCSMLSVMDDGHHLPAKNALLTLHFLFPHELLPALDLLDRRLVKRLRVPHTRRDERTVFTQQAKTGDLMEGSLTAPEEVQQEPVTLTMSPSYQKRVSEADLEVFYIQSASATQSARPPARGQGSGRFKNAWPGNATKMYYEVRLDSWNCSCPAFAQSQLKSLLQEPTRVNARLPATSELDGNPVACVDGSGSIVNDGEANKQEHLYDFTFGGLLTKPGMPIAICKHILAAAIATAAPDIFANDIEGVLANLETVSGWAAGWGEV